MAWAVGRYKMAASIWRLFGRCLDIIARVIFAIGRAGKLMEHQIRSKSAIRVIVWDKACRLSLGVDGLV